MIEKSYFTIMILSGIIVDLENIVTCLGSGWVLFIMNTISKCNVYIHIYVYVYKQIHISKHIYACQRIWIHCASMYCAVTFDDNLRLKTGSHDNKSIQSFNKKSY